MRSPRICSVPCVITTLPSKVASCLASSTVTRSASRLTGLSRSAFSARAGVPGHARTPANSAPARSAPTDAANLRTARSLGLLRVQVRVIGSPYVGKQLEHPRFVVQLEADGMYDAGGVGDGHRTVGL